MGFLNFFFKLSLLITFYSGSQVQTFFFFILLTFWSQRFRGDFGCVFLSLHKSENTVNSQTKIIKKNKELIKKKIAMFLEIKERQTLLWKSSE